MAVPTLNERARITSTNPATGEVLGDVPNMTPEQVLDAVARARAAQKEWGALSVHQRSRFLLNLRAVITDRAEEIAQALSRETGKPPIEARAAEVFPVCYYLTWLARQAPRVLARERLGIGVMGLLGKRSYIMYKPLGVAGVITPWNYPFSISVGEIAAALVSGNGVVHKPSEHTPLIAVKTRELADLAGIPRDIFQVVTGDGATGAAVVDAPVDKVFFTGSVRTGKRIGESCARRLRPCVLELGGKDPMIVLDDAHLENAARGAVWAAFSNSGQTCAAVERCYVQERVYDQFVTRVVALTNALRQGRPDGPVDIGSMNNAMQFDIVRRHVDAARAQGATVAAGGEPNAAAGDLFYKPTVLTNVTHDMACVREETFGPTLPIMKFATDDEAVRLANDSAYGLTASVWSRDQRRAFRIAEQLEAGTVTVNDHMFTHAACETPWGGVKESGQGVTHSRFGLYEFCRRLHVNTGRADARVLWWYPYSDRLYRALAGAHEAAFGRGFWRRARGIFKAVGAFLGRKRPRR
ncbi:MAG: aldehyde dehydrogenase family protein [Planctomycetes bacterium]|nr:aldehyde dehydrogenase family protein [Planctomycetota bacterium]